MVRPQTYLVCPLFCVSTVAAHSQVHTGLFTSLLYPILSDIQPALQAEIFL